MIRRDTMSAEVISDGVGMARGAKFNFPVKQVFGLRVHAVREPRFRQVVLECATTGCGFAATYATAYTLAMARGDSVVRDTINRFDVCYADGCGVGLASFLLGHGFLRKTTANRYFLGLCKEAMAQGLRIALIGGRPGVAEKVAERIRGANEQSQIWSCHGFASTQRMTNLNGFEAHIVFVAMGQPKQESVALELREKFPAAVIVCVGGLFDVAAGGYQRALNGCDRRVWNGRSGW